ncbi:hypothetical protein [Sphingomonas sp. RS2018]
MIPIPSSRIFRSRWRAIWWSICVIAGAVMFVGFGDAPKDGHAAAAAAHSTDALGQPIDDKAMRDLVKALEGK